MPRMTRDEIVTKLVTRWCSRLMQTRYIVTWGWTECSGYVGRCIRSNCSFRVDLEFERRQSWSQLRDTVIHEIIHIQAHLRDQVIYDLKKSHYMPRAVWRYMNAAYKRQDEMCVDEMARLLASISEWDDADLKKKWKKAKQ